MSTKYSHCFQFSSVQFSSVSQSYVTLCDSMDGSTPAFPVQPTPKVCSTRVHCVSDATTISSSVVPYSSCLQSFPASGSLPMSWLFTSGGQSIGNSASVCPPNEHSELMSFRIDWFDLLTVQGTLKSLLQHHQFFSTLPSLLLNTHIHT